MQIHHYADLRCDLINTGWYSTRSRRQHIINVTSDVTIAHTATLIITGQLTSSHLAGQKHKKTSLGKKALITIISWFLPRCMECRRGLAMRILSVRPSVRPSVRHTRGLWQNGRKICPDLYTIWKNISLVFWEEEWLVGGDPFYVKFWVNRPPLERNRRFWTDNRS